MSSTFSDPEATARRGQEIYDRKYRTQYERDFSGQFLAIDVDSEQVYLGANPQEAVKHGKTKAPSAIFHLIRIGSIGAFRVGHTGNETDQRVNS